ncbi:MAG TPA: gamma-glutamyl-gamma-aminobutyrate hydrolase family protein, partial [Deinococcales bacterium]|nr:gamma-glutamyl-gamma-aminobutyrate hydrolase family protein [Deinococcales bacterium]
PRHYGQDPIRDLGRVDVDRDAFELALYRAARARGLPVLGICRGEQVINVAEGGTLHQHIDRSVSALDHSQDAGDGEPHHAVQLEADSVLAEAYGAEIITVNSYHHQAVDRPGTGLRVTARSSDGLAEAVEGTEGAWLLGVQWHPEMSFRRHEEHLAPFRAFLDAVNRTRLQPA